MRGQLEYLIEAAARPNITVQVLPFSAGWHPAMYGMFNVFRFPERAVTLYEAGPRPGEQHYFGTKALASTDLATLRLRAGALDAAGAALEPVLSLPPARRISSLASRLRLVRTELAAAAFHGSPQAGELEERIEEFSRDSATAGLHGLSPGPA